MMVVVPAELDVLGPFFCGIGKDRAATPPLGVTTVSVATAVRRCGAEGASACT